MSWVRAELHFAAFYSYRIPDTSPSFAPTSLVPGPLALRLALVDAAIQESGNPADGEAISNLVKAAELRVVPPEAVTTIRAFIKRLKPREGQLLESTGVREYCHAEGPLEVWLLLEEREEEVARLWRRVTRLGTTDSLLRCEAQVTTQEPDRTLTWQEPNGLPLQLGNFQRRFVATLKDVDPKATFDRVNPYAPGSPPYRPRRFVLPLVLRQRGENWARYEREPFDLGP